MAKKQKQRCAWCGSDPIYIDYHDREWGVPLYDEQGLFEFLMLEGMQAGLSWITILKRRDTLRKAFANFDAKKLVRYDKAKIDRLMQNEGVIRHRKKIEGVVNNASRYLAILEEYGSFSDYIWAFSDGKVMQNSRRSLSEIPSQTIESQKMSKALKQQGFIFVGPTICYAFMQAVGMVNDHLRECYRHDELR